MKSAVLLLVAFAVAAQVSAAPQFFNRPFGSTAGNTNVGTANAGLGGASATSVSSSNASNGGSASGFSNSLAQGGFRPTAQVNSGGVSNSQPGFGGFGGGFRPGGFIGNPGFGRRPFFGRR